MDRGELRAMVRRMLSPEESVQFGDSEINSLINQAIIQMSRDVAGNETTASLNMATNADGTVSLPTDCIKIRRVENSGVRMGRIGLDEIKDTDDTD